MDSSRRHLNPPLFWLGASALLLATHCMPLEEEGGGGKTGVQESRQRLLSEGIVPPVNLCFPELISAAIKDGKTCKAGWASPACGHLMKLGKANPEDGEVSPKTLITFAQANKLFPGGSFDSKDDGKFSQCHLIRNAGFKALEECDKGRGCAYKGIEFTSSNIATIAAQMQADNLIAPNVVSEKEVVAAIALKLVFTKNICKPLSCDEEVTIPEAYAALTVALGQNLCLVHSSTSDVGFDGKSTGTMYQHHLLRHLTPNEYATVCKAAPTTSTSTSK